MSHQFARLPAWRQESAMTYVERGGELVTRHPFDLSGARMFGFAVKADADRLTEMCERTFGIPSGRREDFVPIGDHVVVAFTAIDSITSSREPDDALGVCSEREASVWVPVRDRRRDRVCWTLPYLFVDRPAAMAGGREIFGFPKQLGTLTFPDLDLDLDLATKPCFRVSAPCIARFAPEAKLQMQPVLRVRRVESAADIGSDLVHLPGDLVGLASDLARGLHGGWTDEVRAVAWLLRQVAFGRLPVVLLKQFRDVRDPRHACYQAIIDVEQQVEQFQGGHLLGGRWQVEVEDLDGEPLQRELGLESTAPAELAFELKFKFRIQTGDVLWEGIR